MSIRRSICIRMSVLTLIGLVTWLAGAGGEIRASQAADQVLRVRLLGDIEGLDPADIRSPHENYLAFNIYNALIRFKPGTAELEPDLAERWDVSKDGRTYTFLLRKTVTWQKGFGKFTSADVKYTFTRIMDGSAPSRYRGLFHNVDRIETPDDYTVRIVLKSPDPTFATNALAFRPGWIVNRKAVEKYGKEYGLNPVGTGPFILESYQRGTRAVLVANPQYFQGAPKVKRIEFIPILKDEVAELALKRGELDIATIRSPEVYQRLKKDNSVNVGEKLLSGVWNLWLDTKQGPFTNRDLRRAVAYGLDREGIASAVLQNIAQPAYNTINPLFEGYTDDIQKYPYDLKKAQDLVKAAGGQGMTVKLLISTLAPWPQVMPVIQNSLEQIGFKVEANLTEYGAFYSEVKKRNYNICGMGLVRPPDALASFAESFASKNSGFAGNFSYYDGIDRLLEAAYAAETPQQRLELDKEMEKKVAEDSPVVPVFYLKSIVASRKNVVNVPIGIINDMWLYRTSLAD
jgi:peptide/nickel transport system substrate-binding protein